MNEWIVGLSKAASSTGTRGDPGAMARLKALAQRELPRDLEELYEAFDGASFAPGVVVWPLTRVEANIRALEPGLPGGATWVFGEKGQGQYFFAAQKGGLVNVSSAPAEEKWLTDKPDEFWCWGLWRSAQDLKIYSSLEQLLTRHIPPAQTEEFGEQTFVKAVSAVQRALDALDEVPAAKKKKKPARKAVRGKQRRVAKKQAPKKATRRAVARKTKKPSKRRSSR